MARLPPLNALRAFEAAARHNGFVGASDELNVTRGAISRHVKLLEDHLGTQLFRRHPKGVDLTEAGRQFLPVILEAFGQVSRMAERVSAAASDLRIICPPATSIRWLIPRLDDFRKKHPEIRVRLTTDFYGEAGFDIAEYDLGFSIESARSRGRDISVQTLFPMLVSPACAPTLLQGTNALRAQEDLKGVTLLHDTPKRSDWAHWIATCQVEGLDPLGGDEFPNLDMSTKAAVLGAGGIMADLVLCGEELASGALVLPFPALTIPAGRADVCLLGPYDRWETPKVWAFRDWAVREAQKDIDKLCDGPAVAAWPGQVNGSG
jgi:LysR family glycine cleavage system transcriptional activator